MGLRLCAPQAALQASVLNGLALTSFYAPPELAQEAKPLHASSDWANRVTAPPESAPS